MGTGQRQYLFCFASSREKPSGFQVDDFCLLSGIGQSSGWKDVGMRGGSFVPFVEQHNSRWLGKGIPYEERYIDFTAPRCHFHINETKMAKVFPKIHKTCKPRLMELLRPPQCTSN